VYHLNADEVAKVNRAWQ